MTTPLLSICIPTHHGRATVLLETLDSIAEQARDEGLTNDIEICLSDNASRDSTAPDVARWQEEHREIALVYRRNAHDLRLENILKVVNLAAADWCWFLGSDDHPVEGTLSHILDQIRRAPDASGIAMRRVNFDGALQRRIGQDAPEFFPDAVSPTTFTGFDEIVGQLGLQFCNLSSNVVQRHRWTEAVRVHRQKALARELWPQVVLMTEMARSAPRWTWSPHAAVRSRSRTTFIFEDATKSQAQVMTHVIETLGDTWAALLGPTTPAYRAVLERTYAQLAAPSAIAGIKDEPGAGVRDDIRLLRTNVSTFWRLPRFWSGGLGILLQPSRVRRRIATRRARAAPAHPLSSFATAVSTALPQTVVRRRDLRLPCRLTNRGDQRLSSYPPNPIGLAYRWLEPATGTVVLEDYGAMLPRPLAPGTSVELSCVVLTPWDAGTYVLSIAPVQHDVARFEDVDPNNGWMATVQVASDDTAP